jgi:hypothetical protein
VLQADQETRFRISGPALVENRGMRLIRTAMPWRLDWISFGLYADGWTRPGRTARIRVFAYPGQHGPRLRTLTIGARAPEDVSTRRFSVRTNLEAVNETATPENIHATVSICVPAHGYAQARLRVRGSSTIPGDLRDYELAEYSSRVGGIFVDEIALADEVGGPCRP